MTKNDSHIRYNKEEKPIECELCGEPTLKWVLIHPFWHKYILLKICPECYREGYW